MNPPADWYTDPVNPATTDRYWDGTSWTERTRPRPQTPESQNEGVVLQKQTFVPTEPEITITDEDTAKYFEAATEPVTDPSRALPAVNTGAPFAASPEAAATSNYYAESYGHVPNGEMARIAGYDTEDSRKLGVRGATLLIVGLTVRGILSVVVFLLLARNATDSGPSSVVQVGFIGGLLLTVVTGMMILAGFIMFIIWQYRAAKISQRLGLIGNISPGLGVVSWFIPIVNFILPVFALHSILPGDREYRRKVVTAWVLLGVYLVTTVSGSVVGLTSMGASSTALVFEVVSTLAIITMWIILRKLPNLVLTEQIRTGRL